jgi:putative acetyltransferase
MPLSLESPNQPEILALIEELDAYQRPLYPAESHHGIDLAALSQPNVLFAVARDDEGRAVGCGAIVLEPEYGEIKRMYTSPSQRGKGIARALLGFLERLAQGKGCKRFALETGYLQPEALSLYARCGYLRCGPFGAYTEDPNSVFMQKVLT